MLTVIDEFTRRCMAVVVERRLNSDNVLHCLTELFVQHGPPDHIRSDNGSEFTAHAVRDRNLSTTLRHRRFLFTDSFLLLWKWRVG